MADELGLLLSEAPRAQIPRRAIPMTPFFGEILGTALLILLGDGTVANVVLAKSKAHGAGWIVVATGWAMGVYVGALTVASISGAHLNPAVSLGLAMADKFAWSQVPVYVAGQMIGAMIGAALVWLAYLPHWAQTSDPDRKSTRLNSSHQKISYAVFCLKKKKTEGEGPTSAKLDKKNRSMPIKSAYK